MAVLNPQTRAQATREALLAGPVFPQVVRFGIPTMISMLTPAIYNTTAAYFVSDLGTTAIAALGIVFALHMIMASIGIMAGQGCASQTSRLLGAGDDEAAGFIAGTGIVVSLFGGTLLTVLGLVFVEPLLRILGATPTIMPDAKAYAQVLLMCAPIISVGFTFNNLLRSEGLAIVGMRALLTGGLFNLVLTPCFIQGLGMGIEGAAWAAVIAQTVSTCLLVSHYVRGHGLLKILLPTKARFVALAPRILRNGLPSLLRNGLAAVAASVLNVTAAGFGDAAVAGMSIVGRVIMIVNAIMVGLGQGYQPVAGFNWGAGNYLRVRTALLSTVTVGTCFMTLSGLVGWWFAKDIVSVFANGDPDVIAVGTLALQCQFMCFPFIPGSMIANMTYQVLGRAKVASLLSSLRQGLCFLPLIVVLPNYYGLTGLAAAQPLADVAATLLSLFFLRAILREAKARVDGTFEASKQDQP